MFSVKRGSINQPLPFFSTGGRGGIEGFQSFAKLDHFPLHQPLAITCHNGLLFLRSRQPFEVYCTVGKACGVLDDASFRKIHVEGVEQGACFP